MNILFLTRCEPMDINMWSGTLYYVYHKLKEKHHVEVKGTELIFQLEMFARTNLHEKFVVSDRYIKELNILLAERINSFDYDLIFLGDLFFGPFLEVNIPYILLSDATYEQFATNYKGKPDEKRFNCIINLERLMLEKSFRIIHSSQWIKEKAVEFYNINPDKIDVIEFGANIPTPTEYTIDINMDVCRLIFIGRNWEKKGGDKVLQAYRKLKAEGFPCSLTIIGSTPKETLDADEDITIIPFLNKEKKDHLNKLCQILSEAHFLVLPTQFDAYGIVFCEASAYGVPSIASNVGGVGQPVREGKNGFLLSPDATAADYAEKIKTVFSDKENYIKLRASSRHEFETRLNWDVWGERVDQILKDAVREWKSTKKPGFK